MRNLLTILLIVSIAFIGCSSSGGKQGAIQGAIIGASIGAVVGLAVNTRADAEFHKKLESSLIVKSEMPIPTINKRVAGKLVFKTVNRFEKPIRLNINVTEINETLWKINPLQAVLEVIPGDEKQADFDLSYNADSLSELPKFTMELYYSNKLIAKQERKFGPSINSSSIFLDHLEKNYGWIIPFPY